MEAQRDFIKSNYEAIVNNKTTLSKDNIFSFQNIIEYLFDSHNTNNKEKFAEVIKRMQRNDIINIDINDYTFILKYVLQKY